MAPSDRAELAARNNAAWCDAIFRSHGAPGEFVGDVWLNRSLTLPFYPNLVTLTASARVDELVAQLPSGAAIKDSFASLDLGPLGFAPLFDATWIWRDAAAPTLGADLEWSVVGSSAELDEWAQAWGDSGIFVPPLLDDSSVALFAGRRDGRTVAGCAANLAAGVVGISNVFGAASAELWAAAIAAVSQHFGGHPIVGYEAGDDLDLALGQGFEPIGPLRVWGR